MSSAYIFDSSAILTLFGEEKGASKVQTLLRELKEKHQKGFLNIVNLGEIYYITYKLKGVIRAERVLSIVDSFPLEIVQVDRKLMLKAARFKANFDISYADAYVAATAVLLNGGIVTKDKDFRLLEDIMKVVWI